MAKSIDLEESHLIIVMGVSGCGKSTIAKSLAAALQLPLIEGDELHPKHNVDKMSRGEPLTDVDREPWLKLIRKKTAEICDRQWEEYVKEQVRLRTQTRYIQSGLQRNHAKGEKDLSDASLRMENEGKLRGVIVSCSALKKAYRDILRGEQHMLDESHPDAPIKLTAPPPYALRTIFVFLNGPKEVLEERMSSRQGHFMKRAMLESQLDTLEDPTQTGEEGVIDVDITLDTDLQVAKILEQMEVRIGVRESTEAVR